MSAAELANLKRVRATGVLSVQYRGRLTVYRSQAEMDELIASAEAEQASTTPIRRVTVFQDEQNE